MKGLRFYSIFKLMTLACCNLIGTGRKHKINNLSHNKLGNCPFSNSKEVCLGQALLLPLIWCLRLSVVTPQNI